MGRIFYFSSIMLLCATLVYSQVPNNLQAAASDEPATFRTGTRLVQVDVVVRGKDAPIDGLTKDDFEVSENGKKQAISIFSVRKNDPGAKRATPLPAGVISNRPAQTGPEPVAATVILMDRLNTLPEDQSFARAQAMKILDHGGQMAVYSLNLTFKVVQDFTDDRDALRKAIGKATIESPAINQDILSGIPGNAANAAMLNAVQRRADTTSAAFALIARHLKGLPGRKKLIWITAGLPLTLTQDNERNLATLSEFNDLSPSLFAAMRLMNDANVAIYSIDPRGVLSAFSQGLMDPNLTSLIRLSQMTGGTAFYGDNDVAAGIDAAMSDTDLTYTLGFYQPEEPLDGVFHPISVKVLRTRESTKGIQDVRYRRGYVAEQPRTSLTEKQRKGTLNAWVDEPLDATELGLQAAAVPAKNRAGYYDVEVAVDIADLQLEQKNNRWVGSFEVAIVPDVENKPKGLHQVINVNLTQQNYVNALAHGITVVNQVRVTNDKGKLISKRLHLVVMDAASGKSGSVRIPIGQ